MMAIFRRGKKLPPLKKWRKLFLGVKVGITGPGAANHFVLNEKSSSGVKSESILKFVRIEVIERKGGFSMKRRAAAIGLSILILGGCSLLNEASSTLTYAADVKEFLNETQQFASEVPALLEEAAANPAIVQDIQAELENMKQNINGIQELDAPAIAEGVHSELINYSTQLETSINKALSQIENGHFDPSSLVENTDFMQTIQELQELQENIEQLGK